MNKRQFNNMLRRRADKKPAPIESDERVFRAPTLDEMAQLERLERAAHDESVLLEKVEVAWKKFHILECPHWLWRAGKLLAAFDQGPRPNHPLNDSGKPKSMRSLLGLPNDPKRQEITTTTPVVRKYVASRHEKGHEGKTALKPIGYREVEHAPEFYLHATWYGTVEPLDMLKWLEKIIDLVSSEKLPDNIRWMEQIYGTPRQVGVQVAYGQRQERLVSKETSKVPGRVPARGKRLPKGPALKGQGIASDSGKGQKAHGPFHQDEKLVNRDFAFSNRGED